MPESNNATSFKGPLSKHFCPLIIRIKSAGGVSVRLDAPQDATVVSVEPLLLTKKDLGFHSKHPLNML